MSENETNSEVQNKIELMKQNCIFCKIVNGEMDSMKVFEDELCLAILDIRPATNGHLLLMPKEHYMIMQMVPDNVLGHLSVISKYLCDLLKESLGCIDSTIYIANGSAAGQQSHHFMFHIIPEYESDKVSFSTGESTISDSELEELAKQMREKLESGNYS